MLFGLSKSVSMPNHGKEVFRMSENARYLISKKMNTNRNVPTDRLFSWGTHKVFFVFSILYHHKDRRIASEECGKKNRFFTNNVFDFIECGENGRILFADKIDQQA